MVTSPGFVRTVAPSGVLGPALAIIAGLLLFGVWGGVAGVQLAQTSRQAGQRTVLAAQGVADGIDATLARFAEQLQAVGAPDFAGGNRVAQITRLLRLQGLLPAGAATFMLRADGKLLAASAPFMRQDADVADAAWFHPALAEPPDRLAPLPLDRPWLGIAAGLVLSRLVVDDAGKPVGLVGAVLPQAALAKRTSPGWLDAGTTTALQVTGDGAVPADQANAALPWATARMLSALRWMGQPAGWAVSVPLRTIDATVLATTSPAAALPVAVLGPPLLLSGAGVLLAWVMGIFALCRRWAGAPPVPAGFGADWQCNLDRRGVVQQAYGTLPTAAADPRGEPLAAVVGLAPGSAAGEQIAMALQHRTAVALRIESAGRAARISLAPGPAGGFVCTGRDITDEVLAIAAREAARRDQDRLLTALGHDIRTPMTSIMGICELLLDGELEQDQRTWLERVFGSCGALLGMMNGLLEVAGDQVGRATSLREPVEVAELMQEVADVLRSQARDKGLELRIRCDDLLRGQWLLDPARLRQVVFNLAGNAVKFTAAGRVEIRASAIETDGQSRLRIAVADTGPGIDPDEREQIFERFKRGRAQEGSGHAGLGLGLALCRENAALMGGSITLESALGVGSEFTFECPAERVSAQNRLLPFAGRTALIVADDNPATRALAGQLGELGLMVETAPDGYLGLALAERLEAQRGAVDLVVLQGSLPGMAGEVFVRRLRGTPFGRRAVLLWVGNGAESAAVDASIPAPPDPYQVAAVARQLLAERPSMEALEPNLSVAPGGRVLLVEDDKANQALLAAALTRRGFAVFTTGNGEEAVRLAGRDTFDAILMDLQMPGLDGFEATRRIRALPGRAATVPIVALTALQGTTVRQRCTEAGFTAVLEKPVNLDRLTACLHRWVGDVAPDRVADPAADGMDYVADVSVAFLEEMVAVVGLDRARACVAEFITGATARCLRLGELVPGWEVGAILRSCEEISGMAETCGALALGELLEEIADAASRDDRPAAEALIARLDTVIARLPHALTACLDDVARRWSRDSKAA